MVHEPLLRGYRERRREDVLGSDGETFGTEDAEEIGNLALRVRSRLRAADAIGHFEEAPT